MSVFRKIATRAREHFKDNKDASLCHNFLATLDQETFDDIFSFINDDERALIVLQSLRLIESLPDAHLWRELLPEVEDHAFAWNSIARGVFEAMDHQSQQATDVRWLKLIFMAICGRIVLPAGIDEFAEELRLYPNHGDMTKVRPKIRAMEMAFRSMESGEEKADYIPDPVHESVWEEFFRRTNCLTSDQEFKDDEGKDTLLKELMQITDAVIDHFMNSIGNTHVDARCDSSFGLTLYNLNLTYELAHIPSRALASGRILLRTIAESFITLCFLKYKDDPTIWLQYRNYGYGQTALAFLKTSVFENAPDYIDMERLEMLANEDVWFETRDIKLGAWANKNLRKMSQEAGVKDVYDRYYDWTSGFVHGHWGSIRDAVFTTCLNPLHRLHRVPQPMQPMPSVLTDCCKLCNRTLDELNALYPGFNARIGWHKKEQ